MVSGQCVSPIVNLYIALVRESDSGVAGVKLVGGRQTDQQLAAFDVDGHPYLISRGLFFAAQRKEEANIDDINSYSSIYESCTSEHSMKIDERREG